MAQTSTLCHEEALKITPEPAPDVVSGAEPSERVISNILAFSRNLDVKRSKILGHLTMIKS